VEFLMMKQAAIGFLKARIAGSIRISLAPKEEVRV
jgi:hypothetical protein